MIESSQELNELQDRYAHAISGELNEKPHIYVGAATCGRAAGALGLLDCINRELDQRGLSANVVQVGCIGLCYAEPLVDIAKPNRPHIYYSNVKPEMIPLLIEEYLVNDNPRSDLAMGTIGEGKIDGIPNLFDLPVLKPQTKIVLSNCGHINPESLPEYIARGGYQGLAKALSTMTTVEVIDIIDRSGLRGRGGAGFPTGRKWRQCSVQPGEVKYIVCNGDEGDPGAFMNRSVLEGDPHRILEGMLIAAYAVGARQGYIYVRAEYPLAVTRLRNAIDDAKRYGLMGDGILGSDFSCEIDIEEGAGAFVCGESTALMFAIEGKRGMPRARPPRSVESGLWRKPTVLNNVETFAHVPGIILNGVDWFRRFGTPTNPGTKTFALAGKVKNAGLVEIPLGLTIRQLIFDIGGGVEGGKRLNAVQIGGPSGGCLPETHLDYGIDFESLTSAGAIMGSGGLVVLDEDDCMVEIARYFMSFTQNESCGKCIPCREGTKRMLEILTRITKGDGREEDIDLLEDIAATVRDASLCGLGDSAPNPVLSTLRYFRDGYEAHIIDKRCPTGACKALVAYHAIEDKCQPCLEAVAGYDGGGYRAFRETLPDLIPDRVVDTLRTSGCAVDLARFSLVVPARNKSCTKCPPCRLGIAQMASILGNIATGNGKPEMLDFLLELGDTIKIAAECPVGQTAPDIVLFTIEHFRDQFEAHILDKRCLPGICNGAVAYHTICPLQAVPGGDKT